MGVKTNQSVNALKDLWFLNRMSRWAKTHSNRISRRDAKNEIRKEIRYDAQTN